MALIAAYLLEFLLSQLSRFVILDIRHTSKETAMTNRVSCHPERHMGYSDIGCYGGEIETPN
jgi:hypothetical protein